MRIVLVVALVACSSPPAPPVKAPAPVPVVQTPDPAPPAFRLPGDVVPVRYRLDQTIVPTEAKTAGVIHVDARVIRPTRVVWLNADEITVGHAELAGKPARVIPGGHDFVGLVADVELPVGPLAIDVAYQAAIEPEKSRGVYSQKEPDGETYAYSYFEPLNARHAFPCFDEPGFKVPWTLVFHVKRDHVALANAPVVKETDEPNGMKRVEIAETKPIPSYLVAFVVGPFEVVDGGTAGRIHTPIRFIVPKGRASELGYAKEVTPKVLVALESYFNMDYPWIKLDVAVVPRFTGTMEHPGIVAMGQPLTLIRPDDSPRYRKESYANVLSHELSHYWFGDLVTMAWWNDTWLNEGLGEWSDINITEAAEPSWHYRDNRVWNSSAAMSVDETLAAQPIRRSVASNTDIRASFDGALTYYKSSAVFRMLEAFVGREAWRTFIHDYLTKHAWGNASADDFAGDMAAKLGAPLADSFRSFLDQPGVPLVEVTPNCAAHQLVIHQRRALPAGVSDSTEHLWKIPVCLRYGDAKTSKRVCKLVDKPEDTIAIDTCPTWIQPNDDGLGYYRSKVDVATVTHEFTRGSGASRVEKLMSILDLRAAIARNELTIDKAFEIAPLLIADGDDVIAENASTVMSFPWSVLDDDTYKAMLANDWRLFGALANRLGWQRGNNDSDEHHRLRASVLGEVAAWDDKLGRHAEKLADNWVAHRTGVDRDLVDLVLWIAAYRGDAARFDRYLAAARAAPDRQEQQRFLGLLATFQDPALGKRALELVLDGGFDLRDSLTIASGMLGNRKNRELGWAWYKEHLDTMLAKLGRDSGAGLLSRAVGAFCDAAHYEEAMTLVKPKISQYDGAENYVNEASELTQQCIRRVATQLPALKAYLAKASRTP